jgi:hypothetical protein
MLFLSLYTPAVKGPPTPEHIAKMTTLIEKTTRDGSLVMTGPLGMSGPGGARVRLDKGAVALHTGPFTDSTLMRAAGFAVLRASSRDDAVRQVKEFMEVAGDGESEILEILEGPPPVPKK